MTRQKKVILDVLRSVNTHPTAEWIYQEAKREIPGLSLGTVYRNLNLLRENGEIKELSYGSDQSHFDGRPKNHYHFCCTECGQVFDVPLPVLKTIERKAKAVSNFQITGHRLEFYGLCEECRQKEDKADEEDEEDSA
ncbi:MAG: transcriptional repressor [Peptococcaceae bacterium]|jgi:Fur family ferric uptake transcriptional regulator/Fur family peroxide stress response transcriptional regulator|nr:transcriptional repressor [Peptococcaceae bacterium]